MCGNRAEAEMSPHTTVIFFTPPPLSALPFNGGVGLAVYPLGYPVPRIVLKELIVGHSPEGGRSIFGG